VQLAECLAASSMDDGWSVLIIGLTAVTCWMINQEFSCQNLFDFTGFRLLLHLSPLSSAKATAKVQHEVVMLGSERALSR